VVDAVGDRGDLIVVAQSFGAFTAPLVCERVSVGMVPAPREAPRDWWANTRSSRRRVMATTTT
jgi:hypothetical protein